MSDFCLILYAHGSRDPRWREPFERLAKDLEADLGADTVRLAYLEFVGPTLAEAVRAATLDGAETVRVLPLFLAAGAHVREDLPAEVARLRESGPDVEIELLPPLGEHREVWEAIRAVGRGAIGERTT